jgi:hypothetical protein
MATAAAAAFLERSPSRPRRPSRRGSACLLATAILPSDTMTGPARAATSAAAMGLAFMGAIVLPVYLVPALTVVLALGLAAESRPALWSAVR